LGAIPHVAGLDCDVCIPEHIQVPKELSDKEIAAENISTHVNGLGVYLPDRNIVICPMGKIFYPSGYRKRHGSVRFRGGGVCAVCTCKCTKEKHKAFEVRMPRADFSKEYNDEGLRLKQVNLKASDDVVRQRKSIVEHPFGTIKRNMDAGYLLTMGLASVSGELSLTFLSYNLKRAINILGAKHLIRAMAQGA